MESEECAAVTLLFGGPGGLAPLASGPRLAGGACIWRSPVSLRSTVAPRAKPRITSNQRDFSGTLLVTKEYEGPGRQPSPVSPPVSLFSVPLSVQLLQFIFPSPGFFVAQAVEVWYNKPVSPHHGGHRLRQNRRKRV